MSPFRIALVVALAGFSVTSTRADVVLVSQERTLYVIGNGAPSTVSTYGVGLWNESVDNLAPIEGNGGVATMSSEISPTRIAASGTLFARDGVQGFYGLASARFVSTFEVTSPQPYSISASWSTDFDFYADSPIAELRFERVSPAPTVYHFSQFTADYVEYEAVTSGSYSASGTLEPGTYRISHFQELGVGTSPGIFSSDAGFNIEIVLPAPSTLVMMGGVLPLLRRRRQTA